MVAPDGTVVVVDFGIARGGESTVSQSGGLLIGTLGYRGKRSLEMPTKAASVVSSLGRLEDIG